jgi:hypothetical protein
MWRITAEFQAIHSEVEFKDSRKAQTKIAKQLKEVKLHQVKILNSQLQTLIFKRD